MFHQHITSSYAGLKKKINVCACTSTCECMPSCVCVCIHTCLSAHVHSKCFAWTYTHIYTHKGTCIYTYIYTYIRTNTLTRTHAHTLFLSHAPTSLAVPASIHTYTQHTSTHTLALSLCQTHTFSSASEHRRIHLGTGNNFSKVSVRVILYSKLSSKMTCDFLTCCEFPGALT